MASAERTFDRGRRRGRRAVDDLVEEFREARFTLGLSQQAVAHAAHVSRARLSRIEGGKVPRLSILEAAQIASVLGLDMSVRAYPGGSPVRDAAHIERLRRVLDHARAPLTCRTEVPLPPAPGRSEQRAWDAMILGAGRRTGVEIEMRLRDGQAVERRLNLKRRDDPTDRFLLLVAATRTNRRVLAERPDLFPDLPRLRWTVVMAAFAAGEHPPTGLLLVPGATRSMGEHPGD
jgi:transcriptional regulator with XRE-family HTH domain